MAKIIADYIWLDKAGEVRCKTMVLKNGSYSVANLPMTDFNGIYTEQSTEQNPHLILKPMQLYPNPFYNNQTALIVLCEVYVQKENGALTAHPSNTRNKFTENAVHINYVKPKYQITQEYCLLTPDKSRPDMSVKYYAGTASGIIEYRNIATAHLQYCLTANLDISSVYPEAAYNQWAFSIGPVEGVEALDQLIVARYILNRITETANVRLSFHPAPLGVDAKGSACYFGYSTMQTEYPGGYNEIVRIIDVLKETHKQFISLCGEDTVKRLSGEHGSSTMNFSSGVGHTNVSIRIPKDTFLQAKGWFEDRRPSANVDPYKVGLAIYAASIPPK